MAQTRGYLRRALTSAGVFLLLAGAVPGAQAADTGQVKAVYHVNQGTEQATAAIRNIRNHLSADPKAKITVVSHAAGIDFLLEGAKDRNGNPYDALVQELADKGVEFKVCNFTLVTRNIDKGRVIPEASIVPSGVAEVARLQAREGYAYIRP